MIPTGGVPWEPKSVQGQKGGRALKVRSPHGGGKGVSGGIGIHTFACSTGEDGKRSNKRANQAGRTRRQGRQPNEARPPRPPSEGEDQVKEKGRRPPRRRRRSKDSLKRSGKMPRRRRQPQRMPQSGWAWTATRTRSRPSSRATPSSISTHGYTYPPTRTRPRQRGLNTLIPRDRKVDNTKWQKKRETPQGGGEHPHFWTWEEKGRVLGTIPSPRRAVVATASIPGSNTHAVGVGAAMPTRTLLQNPPPLQKSVLARREGDRCGGGEPCHHWAGATPTAATTPSAAYVRHNPGPFSPKGIPKVGF